MGESTVRAYLEAGAVVVSMDLKQDQGQAMVDSLPEELAARAKFIAVDVTRRASVTAAMSAAVEFLGGLDVLAHVAGVQRSKPTLEFTDEDIDFLVRTNLVGTMITNQAALAHMEPAGQGVILNFGSDSGLVPMKNISVYSATKGGIMAWTRSLAGEFGPSGIRVNTVVPAIKTPMTTQGRGERGAVYSSVPLGGDLGEPDADLAPVMVFLASDDSRFITGQMISVNGGLCMVR
ncbi:SDR family NAD(P)-dependent oxidoreductase [Citricoccus parietis]